MDIQFLGRHQRPRMTNIKQALEVILLLATCAWLIYQFKHSNKAEDYADQIKFNEKYGALSLGHLGKPSGLDDRAVPNLGNVNFVSEAKKGNKGRNEVFVGTMEDNAEEEFGIVDEKFRTDEGREVEKEPEKQSKASVKTISKDSSKENHGKVHVKSKTQSDHKEQGKKKYPKIPVVNDSQSYDKKQEVKIRETPNEVHIRLKAKSDGSVKENNDNEDLKISEKEVRNMMQEHVVEGAKNIGLTESLDEVHRFHDENGIPPDGIETEPLGGQAHILHEKNISSFSNESGLRKSNIYEVTSGEVKDAERTVGGTTVDATADGEINSESVTHVDTSGINHPETREV